MRSAIRPVSGSTIPGLKTRLVLQEALDNNSYDELVSVARSEGIQWSRELVQCEGVFTGISGGAMFAAALRAAQTAPEGPVILCILSGTGGRYLSTPPFEGVQADMGVEEIALIRSTPGFQLG